MKKKKVYKAFLGLDLKNIMPKGQSTGGDVVATAANVTADTGNIIGTFSQKASVRDGVTPRDIAGQKGEAIGDLAATGGAAFLSTFGIPPSISKGVIGMFTKPLGKLIGKLSTSKAKISKFNDQDNALKSNKASTASREAYSNVEMAGNVQSFAKGGEITDPNKTAKGAGKVAGKAVKEGVNEYLEDFINKDKTVQSDNTFIETKIFSDKLTRFSTPIELRVEKHKELMNSSKEDKLNAMSKNLANYSISGSDNSNYEAPNKINISVNKEEIDSFKEFYNTTGYRKQKMDAGLVDLDKVNRIESMLKADFIATNPDAIPLDDETKNLLQKGQSQKELQQEKSRAQLYQEQFPDVYESLAIQKENLATGRVDFDPLTQLTLGALGAGIAGKAAPLIFSNPTTKIQKTVNIIANLINPLTSKSGKLKKEVVKHTKAQFEKQLKSPEFLKRADALFEKRPDLFDGMTRDEFYAAGRNLMDKDLTYIGGLPSSTRKGNVIVKRSKLPDPKLRKKVIVEGREVLGVRWGWDDSIDIKVGLQIHQIRTTTVHELTHSLTNSTVNLPPQFIADSKRLFLTNKELQTKIDSKVLKSFFTSEETKQGMHQSLKYLSDPTEIHARMNEIRNFRLNKSGKGYYDKWTPENITETANLMIKKKMINPAFFKYMRNNNGKTEDLFTKMMNEMFSISAIGTAGAIGDGRKKIKKFRNGGELANGKAIVLGGELHKDGGNKITDEKGEIVAETEREELLLDAVHAKAINKHVKLFKQTGDETHYIYLGKIAKEMVEDSIDNSGKYS